jgi:hypothetical protein
VRHTTLHPPPVAPAPGGAPVAVRITSRRRRGHRRLGWHVYRRPWCLPSWLTPEPRGTQLRAGGRLVLVQEQEPCAKRREPRHRTVIASSGNSRS